MPSHLKPAGQLACVGIAAMVIAGCSSCSSKPADMPPPTIAAAQAAESPPVSVAPAGVVRPLTGAGLAAVFDPATASLVVLSDRSAITVFPASGAPRVMPLSGPATAMAGDGRGRVDLSTRGGYFRFDIADGAVTRLDVDGEQATDFTAITRRAD